MRLIITGATGYLGQRLALQAAREHDVVSGYSRRPGAVTAGDPVRFDFSRPQTVKDTLLELGLDGSRDAIIHTAAINPGGDEDLMTTVNVAGSRAVAEAAAEAGVRLIQISTDVVHDGRSAPYDDHRRPTPLTPYAETKAQAEDEVAAIHTDCVVVRTSLIYGLHRPDRGTAGFMERLENGDKLKLFHDVIRQPIWVESLAKALVQLVSLSYQGCLNVAGGQAMSRDQFGRKMLKYWQVPESKQIQSVSAAHLSDKIPLDLRLDLTRAEGLGLRLPGVENVLAAAAIF